MEASRDEGGRGKSGWEGAGNSDWEAGNSAVAETADGTSSAMAEMLTVGAEALPRGRKWLRGRH